MAVERRLIVCDLPALTDRDRSAGGSRQPDLDRSVPTDSTGEVDRRVVSS
jgi:hypothetical protein